MTKEKASGSLHSTRITNEGYLVVPVKIWPTSSAVHYLYIKKHQANAKDSSSKESILFVLNVPPFITEDGLRRLFSKCGPIKEIFVHEKPTSKPTEGKTVDSFTPEAQSMSHKLAYVVFHQKESLDKATSATFQYKQAYCTEKETPYAGLAKWCCEYGSEYVQPGKLKQEVDEFMETFDKNRVEEKQTHVESEGVPDEDGWIKVTHHSRKKGLARTEVNEKRVAEREKKKRKQKELLTFYTFQQKQQKQDYIAMLRKKFEEDKKKVEQMKSARKFRPY